MTAKNAFCFIKISLTVKNNGLNLVWNKTPLGGTVLPGNDREHKNKDVLLKDNFSFIYFKKIIKTHIVFQ